MSRSFRLLSLLVLSCYLLSGCGSDTPVAPTTDESKAAQETATKMPPPPGAKNAR